MISAKGREQKARGSWPRSQKFMENDDKKNLGLSEGNRQLIVVVFFLFLLIWGPIEPYGMVVRTAYLVLLPILLWYGLKYFGGRWKGDQEANTRLTRAIAGIIAGVFFVGAYLAFTATYHTECTKSIQTRDGSECVGDYVAVQGNDLYQTFMFGAFGLVASWYAVAKHKDGNL